MHALAAAVATCSLHQMTSYHELIMAMEKDLSLAKCFDL